jgi:hypothetical protein
MLTLSTQLCIGLYSGLFSSGFSTSNLQAFLLSPIRVTCPRLSHPSRLDYSNYTWRRVQITKLFVMQFSLSSLHLISLRSKYPLNTLFSNTLSLCHPCTTTLKIIAVYIRIFKCFDSKREDNVLDRMGASIIRIQCLPNVYLQGLCYMFQSTRLVSWVPQTLWEYCTILPSSPNHRLSWSLWIVYVLSHCILYDCLKLWTMGGNRCW